MAYPNPIKTTGALSIGADVFEYFKGAALDTFPSRNPEGWPYYMITSLVIDYFLTSIAFNLQDTGSATLLTLPIDRAKFYRCVDFWSGSPTPQYNLPFTTKPNGLYSYSEPISGWTVDNVNDWGKIKSVELALFGNVGNGGSLTSNTLSKFNGMTMQESVNTWTNYDMNYLRYGLIKFDSYGSCHPNTD